MKLRLFAMLLLTAAVFTTTMAQNPATPNKPTAPAPPHDHSHMSKNPAEASPAEKYFTDVELIDQNGKKVRFYTDVLKGKTVVVNAFFTSCTSVCPPMNRNMQKIQEAFGDRVGRDVFLVSITVDPAVDTPEKMKNYAKNFHAGPGWMFLTGKKENLDWALYKLGQYVESKDDHTTVLIVGNEKTGLWKKAFAMANVAELVQVVESVANDKGSDKGATN